MQSSDSDYSPYSTDTDQEGPTTLLTDHYPPPTYHIRLEGESESENSTYPADADREGPTTLLTDHRPPLTDHVQAEPNSEEEPDEEDDAHSSDEGKAPSSNNTTIDEAPPVEPSPVTTVPCPTPPTSTPRRGRLAESKRSRSTDGPSTRSRGTRPTKKEDDELDMRTLTPVQVRQLQTRQALRQLRSPPNTTTFTPQHHDILSENVKLLLDATRDPSELPDTDEDGDRSGGPTGSSGRERGWKRSRSKSRSKSVKKQKVPDLPETAGNQGPLERLPPGPQVRVPGDNDNLIKLNPQPVQMWFRIHPVQDRTDEWFVHEFRLLFRRLEAYFDNYFCIHNLDEGEFHQPWAANHTPEFLTYVLQVAEADPNGGDWDKILRDTDQRKWLLVGIMMTILENKVFNADLWGATKEEKELMFGIEKALFTQEGFARTKLRAETVRTILRPGPVTTDFHIEVAKLTAQVSLLFKPLVDYMYAIPPPDGATVPKLWDRYQDLHNIISQAAYLSLCIRLSPTIFYFTPLSPGEAFQPNDQHCLETQVFTTSKAKVVADYGAAFKSWNEKRIALEKRLADLKVEGQTGVNVVKQGEGKTAKGGRVKGKAREADAKEAQANQAKAREAEAKAKKEIRQAQSDLEAHNKTNPRHYGFSYRALTKVCAWPNIRRFKPGSLEQEKANTPLELRTGFRIYEVSKSAAVMYFGTEDRAERARQRVCLRGLVGKKQREYGAKNGEGRGVVRAAAPYALGIAAFAALPAWAFAERFRGTGVTEALMGLAENFRGGFVF